MEKAKKKPTKRAAKIYAEVSPKAKPGPLDTREISTVDSSFYGRLQRYNPDDLVGKKGLTIYRKMSVDEQIKAAIYTKIFAVLSSGWEIQAAKLPKEEKEMADELKEFSEWNFEEMEDHFDSKLQEALTALIYGYAAGEKVLYLIDFGRFTGKIGQKDIKFRKPESIEFETDEHGNISDNGVVQTGKKLPRAKFLIYSYRKQFSNWYGQSDLREAYRAWFLKDTILKYMSIGLERYGEPIADIEHEGAITPAQRTNLENFAKNVQSRSGLIHDKKIQLKFHTPGFRADIFVTAINLYDTHLRIAILMPGLMGMAAEKQVGSLARSRTEFNVFLWIVNQLRLDLETVINEQVIKPLIDLNYEVTGGQYPKFKFREVDEEREAQIYEMWLAGLNTQALKKFPEDEAKMRGTLSLAEKTDEELTPEPPPESPGMFPSEEGGEGTSPEGGFLFQDKGGHIYERGFDNEAELIEFIQSLNEERIYRQEEKFICDFCYTVHYHTFRGCSHFAFCPTGEGGGIDNSCSSAESVATDHIELNKLPHRTPEDLAKIPQIKLKLIGPSHPSFLAGTKATIYAPVKTDNGWTGSIRMPRTGDFAPRKLFPKADYDES